jgi:3-oxoacyl-(acyl-carrier-protein) synthase
MKGAYINGLGCISAQKTFDHVFGEGYVINEKENILLVHEPVYKDFISPVSLRRMSRVIRNGIVASTLAMNDARVENPDAIITGTGMGCVEDSNKFLKSLIDNNEEFLTPTSFIQSTHNSVGAQIALGLQCKGYIVTYVTGAVSFESALLDAKLKLEEHEAKTILAGGIDETTEYSARLYKLAGIVKADGAPVYPLLDSQTNGVVFGEGATFFVLEDEKKESTYAQVVDVSIFNQLDVIELESKITEFLATNGKLTVDIDAVVLGFDGDVNYDNYYKKIAETCFINTPQVYYKHLSGEYNTASAFGLWVGAQIMKKQEIPTIFKANEIERHMYRTILLYNQYKGIDHSFILISE